MKKTIVSIIAMLTVMTHSYGGDEMQSIKLQMLDSEIEKLTQERDTKYEQLKKCEKTTKGFKIAGITTLSLTAVGVAANIGEAHKIKENKGIITSNDATIKAKEEAIRKEEERKRQEKAEEDAKKQNGQSGQNGGTGGTEVVTDEEGTDETNPTTPATGTPKKSKYMPSCESTAKQGDACDLNPNASKAICMDLGNKDEKGKVLYTCTAKECAEGYVLRLRSDEKSNGRCDSKDSAENYCKNQGENCKPKYHANPNNNVADAAYIFHECECGGTTNTKNSSSSSSNSSSANTNKMDVSIDGTKAYGLNHDGTCDYYDGSKWHNEQAASKCPELSKGQWKVEFIYGTVTGTAQCATNGDRRYAQKDTPIDTNGQCCWCKADQSDIVLSPSWVFSGSCYGGNCASYCVYHCTGAVFDRSYFRKAIFGITE